MKRLEWPTLGLLIATYGVWAIGTTVLATWSLTVATLVTALAIAQFSSLQHEMIHGHPFKDSRLNALLVFPALTLVVPYLRFRDTHLAHHKDSDLTDPYDDPESSYLDSDDLARLARWQQGLFEVNNTLLGRVVIGPAIGTFAFLKRDMALMDDPSVRLGWLLHVPAVVLVVVWVTWSAMPFWAYALSAYGGLALIRIRTFAEHQAHEQVRGRSVIIEDRGPLALLFLNNNLHVVHHSHPGVSWYRLPALYRSHRERYLRQNDGYLFRSYGEVFRRYLLARKDPVAHPLSRRL